jgi:hypothetical protein
MEVEVVSAGKIVTVPPFGNENDKRTKITSRR